MGASRPCTSSGVSVKSSGGALRSAVFGARLCRLPLCIGQPTASLLVLRPSAEEPPAVPDHPNVSFDSLDDPLLRRIIDWINQGAER